LNLDRHNNEKKSIDRVKRADGIIESDQANILLVLKNYFKMLYKNNNTASDIELENYLSNILLTYLSQAQSECISTEILESECLSALSNMSSNKSPDSDGYTVEFYKMFWKELKFLFLSCANYSFTAGHLSDSQREVIIILLPKPQKDLSLPNNYRPITLLNADYRILTSVINNRMKPYLNDLIQPGQNAFIKGRHVSDTICLLFDVLDYIYETDIPGSVLTLDIFKAFDSINWNFMFVVLQKNNFGPIILKWIKTFYAIPLCKVSNNNFLSEHFEIRKKVRQGDPLSPTLFILCIECVASVLQNRADFFGLTLGDVTVKILLFADDTTVFLNSERDQFDIIFDIFTKFSNMSGCKINWEKSKAFFIGVVRNYQSLPLIEQGLL